MRAPAANFLAIRAFLQMGRVQLRITVPYRDKMGRVENRSEKRISDKSMSKSTIKRKSDQTMGKGIIIGIISYPICKVTQTQFFP